MASLGNEAYVGRLIVSDSIDIAESCSAKAYHQPENKKIHSKFCGVKIGLI